ncbi:MAG TPA: UpxY family transcription antiterminator [Bacteroidota bacterium]|nr:UpxY family transcription antiterminator [Bacteroidota bacterium]
MGGWYVIYTKSRHEKKVYEQLQMDGIESFLAIQKQLRKWSDRKKWVEVPLFSSYVFVSPTSRQIEQVLQVPGVVRYIMFNGRKAIVKPEEIEFLQKVNQESISVEIVPESFEAQKLVKITGGPFSGFTARLLWCNDHGKAAVRIEEIGYSVIFQVSSLEIASVAQ